MKRRIEQLINGRFEYEVPRLLLSETEIIAHTKIGENYRGDLHLGAEDGRKFKGIVTSSHRRFLLGKERFSGNAVDIPYGLDVKGLKAGDVCQGEISLSTNIGEYKLPFQITIDESKVKTSVGDIKTLDEFVNLAQSDYREAFRLFVDEAFVSLLTQEDEKLLPIYRGMSQTPVTYQHLEEFLIGIGKKEPITISLDHDHMELYEVQSSLKDAILIKRSGWGFLGVEITYEGDFLEVEKRSIKPDDFIGSVYGLEYIIRREGIGKGRNYGRIILKTVYQTEVYELMVTKNHKIQVNVSAYEKKKKVDLAKDYLDLLCHQISYKQWYDKTLGLLGEMKDTGYGDPLYQLMEAFVYETSEEYEKSAEILELLEKNSSVTRDSSELEGLYIYLSKSVGRLAASKQDVLKRLNHLYQRQQYSFTLLWILLQVDPEMNSTPLKRLYVLEHQYELGCRSPFLYMEAYQMLIKDGGLLRKLTPFMIQVLVFAKKKGMYTEILAERCAYLSGYTKNFSKHVYELLVYAYEQYPAKDTLDAICKIIMKGDPRKMEYFRWYELAVEQELRITRLYEYYIETMGRNHQKMLPQMIRMYFSYNNTLSDKKKAFVYANVIRNRQLDRNTYQSYRNSMEDFAKVKMMEGRINEDYAVLYQEFCMHPLAAQDKSALAKVLFTYRIYVDDPKVRQIIVCHGALNKEEVYSCVDKVSYISIYTEGAQIIFEDEQRRRYMGTIDYNVQKLLDENEVIQELMKEKIANSGLLLHICGEISSENAISRDNISCYLNVLSSREFSEEYLQGIRQKLLEYYKDHAKKDDLKEYLSQIDFDDLAKVNKSLLIDVLVAQGMYADAYHLLCEYGYEEVNRENLIRLCSRMIVTMEFKEEEELLFLSHYVFQLGVYDEVIMHYLTLFYHGNVNQMIQVWERAKGFQLDAYELEERILIYSMFTRIYLPKGYEVLKSYIGQAGKEQVVLAYLTFEAYGYFIDDRKTDLYIFWSIEKLVEQHAEMDMMCKVSLLKYYSECESLSDVCKSQVKQLLAECNDNGLKFAFFQRFPSDYLRLYQLDDKLFVECKTSPRAKVTLHYCLNTQGDQTEYKSEPLKMVYQGIFNKEFVLFYGEKLTYYFTTEVSGKSEDTKPVTVTMEEAIFEGDTKYQRLNQMLAARNLGRKNDFAKIMEKYLKQEELVRQIFHITK